VVQRMYLIVASKFERGIEWVYTFIYLKCISNIPTKLASFIFFYPALNPLVVIITLRGFLMIIGLVRAFIHSIKNWSILFRISKEPCKMFL